MESARRFRHDLRHHLTVLGTLNAQGRREEITAYLREYGAVADRLDSMSFSGDPGLSSVTAITEKYNGSALFERKNGVFTTRIILNPKQSQNSREAPSK